MKNPKLSIIIPVYNTGEYLSRCLDSVINQTCKNIEIICVNDGSTDNSLQILNDYAKCDDRIIIINQKNLGSSEARNNGLKIIKGKWVGFVDSDDWVDLNYFEELINLGDSTCSDIVMASTKRVEGDNIFENSPPNMTTNLFVQKMDTLNNGSVCDKNFKSNLFLNNDITFPKGLLWEDTVVLVKLIYASNKMVFTTNVFYYYFSRNNSNSIYNEQDEDKQKKHNNDRLHIAKMIMNFITDNNLPYKERYAVQRFILRAIGCHIKANEELQQILGKKFCRIMRIKKICANIISLMLPVKSWRHKIRRYFR